MSRHGYTDWLKPKEPKTDPLLEHILAIKKDSNCRRYGYRRVKAALTKQEIKANHKRVLKTMQKHGLTCKKRQFRICTTNSNHNLRKYPNLIRDIKVVKLNQVWTADITYTSFGNNETAYLALIMDRFSRRFLGWQLSCDIDEQLCSDALDMALEKRKDADLTGLIHHSDQGVQYASKGIVTKLELRGIRISMSRKI